MLILTKFLRLVHPTRHINLLGMGVRVRLVFQNQLDIVNLPLSLILLTREEEIMATMEAQTWIRVVSRIMGLKKTLPRSEPLDGQVLAE